MKQFHSSDIKSFAIVEHGASGKMHPVDLKDIAFQTAWKNAFRRSFLSANSCLLELIINIRVRYLKSLWDI